MQPSVSIIIRCFNEAAHIGQLMAGIGQQTLQPHEIILVDSGSTDATLRIAERFGPKVISIAPQDFTFGRSLNAGCKAASGDILVIASAHVYPIYDSWLEALVAPFIDESIGLSYGRQVGDHRTRFSEHQVFAKWFPLRSVARQDHPFCNNANAAIRRSLWQELPYNETLTGLEDLEWAQRAMHRGYGVSYVAEGAVAHIHNEGFAQIKNRYRREAIAHKRVFPDQRLSLPRAVGFAAANILSDYSHAARQGKLRPNLLDVPRFRIAQFSGSYQGFKQQGPVAEALLRHFYYPNGLEASSVDEAPGRPIQYDDIEDHRHAA